ncbi:unnamed protein product, partial [Amoebophrya sp. A25]
TKGLPVNEFPETAWKTTIGADRVKKTAKMTAEKSEQDREDTPMQQASSDVEQGYSESCEDTSDTDSDIECDERSTDKQVEPGGNAKKEYDAPPRPASPSGRRFFLFRAVNPNENEMWQPTPEHMYNNYALGEWS